MTDEQDNQLRQLQLSERAWAVVCGLVQSSDDVDAGDIIAPDAVWDEIREAFPLAAFRQAVEVGMIEMSEADYSPWFTTGQAVKYRRDGRDAVVAAEENEPDDHLVKLTFSDGTSIWCPSYEVDGGEDDE